ncbi:MAG: RecQ family ATP-dependent DNA helicase [Balneolaceae bacterium]|nr:RecQ family ATP-dependent DNA helicase [Balneolaceae bacterium]
MAELTLENARDVLNKYWGYDSFRKGQEKAIRSTLEGNQTLVLFPTGGGKSLCYQVPAMLMDGLTVVISPLVALMQDQVDQLKSLGIRAAFINSTLSSYEVEQRLVNARNGMYKMIYLAPERLSTHLWKAEQPRLNISMVAIDEAHCISEWGHDFRPSYRNIRDELEELSSDVRWLALTATATPEVREDLLKSLRFKNPSVITSGFKRENLIWWVKQSDKKREDVSKAVLKAAKMGSGILYCSTRRDCEEYSEYFSKKGVSAKPYHAGLHPKQRELIQREWVSGEVPLVAATNAFGMGIDKADCRYVVHHSMPFSLEAYYQEAGRAGRDGKESYPILLYKKSDVNYLKQRIEKSYPEYSALQKAYDALCDELELAIGSEMERAEPVDINSVSKRFKASVPKLGTALEVLQRLGVIEMSSTESQKIGIRFIADSDYLLQFISESPEGKAEFLDTLYRQAGPKSHGEFVYLKEEMLLEKLQANKNQLKKALNVFEAQDKILIAQYLEETRFVRLLEARGAKLHIDHNKAYAYKDILLKKLSYMHRYAATKRCREVFLRTYFGETDADPCGKCDNCVKSASEESLNFDKSDVDTIKNTLMEGQKSALEIKKETGWKRAKCKKVVAYMLRENILAVSEDGTTYSLKS